MIKREGIEEYLYYTPFEALLVQSKIIKRPDVESVTISKEYDPETNKPLFWVRAKIYERKNEKKTEKTAR